MYCDNYNNRIHTNRCSHPGLTLVIGLISFIVSARNYLEVATKKYWNVLLMRKEAY
jgi:hypothetical protein